MPEVVYSWVNDKDIELVNKIQKNILNSYENDFSNRFSLNNLSKNGKIVNIPLYFIEYINNLF